MTGNRFFSPGNQIKYPVKVLLLKSPGRDHTDYFTHMAKLKSGIFTFYIGIFNIVSVPQVTYNDVRE